MAQGSIEFLREKHDRRYPIDIEAEDEINNLYEKTFWEFQTEKH